MNLLETVVDLGAIAHNTRLLKEMIAPAQLMCVVKADGYNHGAVTVAHTMREHGGDQFGVATLAEALELRHGGITEPILCWIWSPEQNFHAALDNNIQLAAFSPETTQALIDAARSHPTPIKVTIKVDTGLHRSGIDMAALPAICKQLANADNIEVTGLMSHLACADDPDDPMTDEQAHVFRHALDIARNAGLELKVNHLANSPATLSRPDLHFDMVRAGVALYGQEPIDGREHGLHEAMSWVGKVTVVKPIAPGEGTSYSLTWRAKKPGFLAVVPVGYADGLPRAAQGHVEVTIAGHRYRNVGRICMDQCVIDLGDNPFGVRAGDEAIIFGRGGMPATQLAARMGSIHYELLCRPTGRTVRRYVEGA
ncbi:alanine racemase [Corynebacterium felinum]|uniref:Alanine racemase n=1 Tax=Corynebacterium felinum TaxID=131318 RepID=A0ABU2B8M5_9CORY|nr:alanine racemase [Corynebacterium felinum]MDF5820995.1 alanine racemase [Corynebacterium felinum]MDR7354741.1 alanine racemase [Corynebacterium felinum]WJY94104.1 Alanine racemase [Corynebacterium felinum]